MDNPFAVTSPENMSPKQIADLFVDVLSDLPKIIEPGHTFIHGARGTGKSMMLRYLEPEVQKEANKITDYCQLPFFAVHIPLRNAYFISEIKRLTGDRLVVFAEHLLVVTICIRLFSTINSLVVSGAELFDSRRDFIPVVVKYLKYSGLEVDVDSLGGQNPFHFLCQVFEGMYSYAINYLRKLSINPGPYPYDGPLCGYLDFFIPLSKEIRKITFLPNGPLYLMLDDADNVSIDIQKILNNWVSCRTTDSVCLKITTQLRYKTYRTTFREFIETPHDFSEVDLTTVYSPVTSNFGDRIKLIIEKRFKFSGIDVGPDDFFPVDQSQETAILAIQEELKIQWEDGFGRGHRANDDVIRYARPEYIRRLGGTKKATSKYSYAGFDSMVTLANGIIRWFLEPASRMYTKCFNLTTRDEKPSTIPVHIQDSVIKQWSEEFLTEDFDRFKGSLLADNGDETELNKERATKLLNLINGLGQLFQSILLDENAAERRVFSIMISNDTDIDEEISEVLKLGVEWGYLLKSTIGSKEGLGRKPLYILSRRLAPYFKLDVSGFVGNLSVTTDLLKIAFYKPKKFVSERLKNRAKDQEQFSLWSC